MILYINTTSAEEIEVAIKDEGKILDNKTIPAHRAQAEKLLPLIDEILKRNKIDFKGIEKIQVVNIGDDSSSFTALRIGVVTANALGYALGAPVEGVGRFDYASRKRRDKQRGRESASTTLPAKDGTSSAGKKVLRLRFPQKTGQAARAKKQRNRLSFDVVEPVYSRGPNITKKKKNP